MALQDRGLQLRCRDGHFEMASFEVKKAPEGGFWMWVACDFDGHQGGHWLAPESEGANSVQVGLEPYCWPSATEAYAARDRWEAQQAGA